jgi:cell division protein FtsX
MSHPAPPRPPETPARASAVPGSRWRWLLPLLVGAAALLVGAAGASTAFLLLDRDERPVNRYHVTVYVEQGATTEQKEAIRAVLTELPVDGLRFQTREEAWERFKEQYKDSPDIRDASRPDQMKESFLFSTTGRAFDCGAIVAPVRDLPGVDEVAVVLPVAGSRPGAQIVCP